MLVCFSDVKPFLFGVCTIIGMLTMVTKPPIFFLAKLKIISFLISQIQNDVEAVTNGLPQNV
jgi:hypothetical protein